ncbi:hypothetical protein B0H67DRAFT_572376 [Lasiosphaeris hirsuta]|uniref:Uncharacterized protein n=1 Tax=Lasiosphaeris hirsuta TaxID=260670 RepID=A0AA40E3V8_9PEZI|nr:hypothetical protein B0H67DRAFT_572376 [Lasiosphaeris hirsuta]
MTHPTRNSYRGFWWLQTKQVCSIHSCVEIPYFLRPWCSRDGGLRWPPRQPPTPAQEFPPSPPPKSRTDATSSPVTSTATISNAPTTMRLPPAHRLYDRRHVRPPVRGPAVCW